MRLSLIKTGFPIVLAFSFTACTPKNTVTLSDKVKLPKSGQTTVLINAGSDTASVKANALKQGLKVEGDTILVVTGDAEKLQVLDLGGAKNSSALLDGPIFKVHKTEAAFTLEQRPLFFVNQEFGIDEFRKKYPNADGRKVTIGIVDDGVSPHFKGLHNNSDGSRKLLAMGWIGDWSEFAVAAVDSEEAKAISEKAMNVLAPRIKGELKNLGIVKVDEKKARITDGQSGVDLNRNEKDDLMLGALLQASEERFYLCLDINVDKEIQSEECFGTFEKTGEFGYWSKEKKISFVAEVDQNKSVVRLSKGENINDGHAEGVASVAAGFQIGGNQDFSGVAPGASLVDYDWVGAESNNGDDLLYTGRNFLNAIEWTVKKGATVVNWSWGGAFTSAASASFMKKALETMMEKYNFTITFAGGNEGPGLSSFYEDAYFPDDIINVGAYTSKNLFEYVYGIIGVPAEGTVTTYSSRGPGVLGGKTVDVISPLAVVTYSNYGGNYYSAFGGTSSAAPVTAGLFATVASQIIQDNIPLKAKVLAQAIRLSGKAIPNFAFVEQGYGVANATRALEIYKSLLSRETHARIEFSAGKNRYGQSQTGLFLKTSELSEDNVEFQVGLQASRTVLDLDKESTNEPILRSYRVVYGDDAMTGPQKIWIGESASSNISVNLKVSELLHGRNEALTQIEFQDFDTGLTIGKFPVTVVDNKVQVKSFSVSEVVDMTQALRRHFSLETGAQGYLVKNLGPADAKNFGIRVGFYGGNGRAVEELGGYSHYLDSSHRNIFVSSLNEGWNQITLVKSGTAQKNQVNLSVTPVKMKVLNQYLDLTQKALFLRSETDQELPLRIRLKQEAAVADSKVVIQAPNKEFTWSSQLAAGSYELKFEFLGYEPLRQQGGAECLYSIIGQVPAPSGDTKSESSAPKKVDGEFSLKADAKVEFKCSFFEDMGAQKGGADFRHPWSVRLTKVLEKPATFTARALILPGQNKVEFELNELKQESSGRYSVWIDSDYGSHGEIKIGELTLSP